MEKENELLSPTSDLVFQRIFGKKGNESILKDFITAVTGMKIETVKLGLDVRQTKEKIQDKLCILDIKAELDNGIMVNVEIQIVNNYDMIERSLYYWSGLYREQLKKGEEYQKLQKTISIIILDYDIFDEGPYHEIARIRREYENKILTDKLEMHFIQLTKFKEENPGVKRKIEQWMWFLINKNRGRLDMSVNNNKEVKKAQEELEYLSGDEELKRWEELREKALKDERSAILSARLKGIEEGKKEIARKMLEENILIDTIIKVTGLTKEDIEKLKENY